MTLAARRFGSTLAILLLAATLAACGGGTASVAPSEAASVAPPTTAPATEAPTEAPTAEPTEAAEATPGASLATTGRIVVEDKGFAMTLPDGWTRVDLSAGDLEAIMNAAGDLDEDLAQAYSDQIAALVGAGLVIFAFGPDAATGTNVNVLAIPSMGVSLDLIEQLNTSQIEQLAEGDVVAERVQLPAGEAVHFEYTVAAGEQGTVTLDQYLVLVGDNQLFLTVTSGEPGDAQAMAESIEVLD
jgi:hypothetical protein